MSRKQKGNSTKQKDNSIPAAVIGALIGGICTIIAAIIGLSNSHQIEVLDVTGYSVSSAIKTLAENQLQYKIADNIEYDENDIIIDQSIEPGTYVSKGTVLILTVNTETPVCENHIGKELASIDPIHPHYKWYICEICEEKFTLEETSELSDCELCFPSTPPPSSDQNYSGDKPVDSGPASDEPDPGDPGGSSSGSQPDGSAQISGPQPPGSIDFSVVVSYTVIPPLQQFLDNTDENVRIAATTSHKATAVKLTVEPAVYNKEFSMSSSNQINWTFKACFDTAGTYNITAVAYFEDGTTRSDSFSITYPFD